MKPTILAEPPHLEADLEALQLPNVAANWRRLAADAARTRPPYPEYLADLASLEVASRRERRIARRIKDARVPVLKTLDAFDFAAQPALDRDHVLDLDRGDFVSAHHNAVLVGGVGTGKTHLAIALGIACCQHEHRVRFTTAAELTNDLLEAKAVGRLTRKVEQFARCELVIIDELGYVPFDKPGTDLLFGFIARVYERRSLIVTTNLAFAEWGKVFLDPTAAAAVIDRVMHRAAIFKTEGLSYRLKQAKESQPGRREASAR